VRLSLHRSRPAKTRLLRSFASIRVVKYVLRATFQENHRLTKPSESLREVSAICRWTMDQRRQHLVAKHSPSLTRELESELVAPFNLPKNLRRLVILLR
jgi:hypothetical protein